MIRGLFIFMLLTLYFFIKNINAVESKNVTNPSGRSIFLNKCCPAGKIIGKRKSCMEYSETLSFTNIEVYNENMYKTGKSIEDVFTLIPGKFADKTFKVQAFDMSVVGNIYIIENGIVELEIPNMYDRWNSISNDKFCLDHRLIKDGRELSLRVYGLLSEQISELKRPIHMITAMVVSCFFMLLVLIIYFLLPELQSLSSKIQAVFVANLFLAFLLVIYLMICDHRVKVCIGLTMGIYFFFLASFCWMSVISFDIWWTFRGYTKLRQIQQRGDNFKFQMYSLYAFGVPVIMTVGLFVLNSSSMSHLPWFVTPNVPSSGCFLNAGAQFLYLDIPLLILIICSWVFYVITIINVRRLGRKKEDLDSAISNYRQTHSFHQSRLMKNIKLMIFLTIYENVQIFSVSSYGLEFCVGLIGLVIFIIFVCDKRTLKKIWNKICK